MRSAFLFLLLAGAAAGARAADGAFSALVGMAEAAAVDRGPDLSADARRREAPAHAESEAARKAAPAGPVSAGEELKDAPADRPSGPSAAPAEPARAPAPAAPAKRAWTLLLAKLTPAGRVVFSFSEPAPSTGTARSPLPAPALAPRSPSSPAVRIGERRGTAELFSAAAAPVAP